MISLTRIALLFLLLTAVAVASATELVPERFLRPRNFNHHPFTDVGGPPVPKPLPISSQSNPYAILSQKKPREGREFARQNVIFYPSPHPSVLPGRKYLDTNEIGVHDDLYVNIPKNYAFSYIVKDHQSGDDFSHSQAHNGKATRGQYRVKLPDGRVQIVSYTADHKGYRADVQYEDDSDLRSNKIAQESQKNIAIVPTVSPSSASKAVREYQPQIQGVSQFHLIPPYTQDASNHLANPTTAVPKQYLDTSRFILTQSPVPTEATHYFDYSDQYNPSVKPTAHLISSTPRYEEQFQERIVSATPESYVQESYSQSQDYKILASSTADHILVTPRTFVNSPGINKNEIEDQQHVIYKYV